MTQAFTLTVTSAPEKFNWWKAPIGWVIATDEEGNSIIGAVMKNGVIHSDCFGSMGVVIGYQDCADTCKAAMKLLEN